MKTILSTTIIFISLFFVACDTIEITDADMQNLTFKDDELIKMVTDKLDSPFFKSESESDDIQNISYIVMLVIKAKTEKKGENYWQTPEETWNKKTGDCEDISLLIAYCCKQILNIEPDMVRINIRGNLHIIIHYDNIYYDFGNKFSEKELDILAMVDYKYALSFAK